MVKMTLSGYNKNSLISAISRYLPPNDGYRFTNRPGYFLVTIKWNRSSVSEVVAGINQEGLSSVDGLMVEDAPHDA